MTILPCVWAGFLTLYQCPGDCDNLEDNWVNRLNSRNFPCTERHLPGILHLLLDMFQYDIGYVRVPITLSVANITSIYAALKMESASRFTALSVPCTSPRLVSTATGFIYQPPPEIVHGLMLSMQNCQRSGKPGTETIISMCEGDVKNFLKVKSEMAASLQKMSQNRAPQRKKYHQ